MKLVGHEGMKYKTIFEYKLDKLDKEVTEYLDGGWKLYGNQYCKIIDEHKTLYYQPMVKEYDPNPDGGEGGIWVKEHNPNLDEDDY